MRERGGAADGKSCEEAKKQIGALSGRSGARAEEGRAALPARRSQDSRGVPKTRTTATSPQTTPWPARGHAGAEEIAEALTANLELEGPLFHRGETAGPGFTKLPAGAGVVLRCDGGGAG